MPSATASAMGLVAFFAVFHGHAHGAEMPETMSGLAYGASGFSIHVYECGSLDVIAPLPVNCEGGLVFFDVEWFGVAIAGQACGELIRRVKQPRIARFGGEQDNMTNRNDAPIMLGSPTRM
jgi:hypothetical protein